MQRYADEDTLIRIEKIVISFLNEPVSKSNGTIIVATTSAEGPSVNKLLLEMSPLVLSVSDAYLMTISLHKTLTDRNIQVRLVPFLPLTREHLMMCATRLACQSPKRLKI